MNPKLRAGLAIPPLAWFASLLANFAIAPLACTGHGKPVLLIVSFLAVALALAGAAFCRAQRDALQTAGDHQTPAAGLWTARVGSVLGIFFAIVIAAQTIPNLIMAGCE